MRGVPWEPVPASGINEIKSKVRIPGTGSGEVVIEPLVRQTVPRRMRFDQDDLEKYGYTIGRPGC